MEKKERGEREIMCKLINEVKEVKKVDIREEKRRTSERNKRDIDYSHLNRHH